MAIVLSTDVQQQIEDHLRFGLYPTADDVVRAALQLLDERREAMAARREKVREMVEEGVRELESGNHTEYDDESLKALFEEIKADGRRRRGLATDAS